MDLTPHKALIKDLVSAELQARALGAQAGEQAAAGTGSAAPPVDSVFELASSYVLHEFEHLEACPEWMEPVDASSPWRRASVMLMKTDLRAGPRGSNKYYLLQLLRRNDVPAPESSEVDKEAQSDADSGAAPWCMHVRHGRVGYAGHQPGPYMFTSFAGALAKFCKTFESKTGLVWGEGAGPEDVPGKYQVVDMAHVDDGVGSGADAGSDGASAAPSSVRDDDDDDALAALLEDLPSDSDLPSAGTKRARRRTPKAVPSLLPPGVQGLMAMLCDRDALDSALDALSLDRKRMPLGRLAKKQLIKGYKALAAIETAISKGASSAKLADLSSDFYAAIPHAFGMSKPPTLSSVHAVADRRDALDTLAQMDVAGKVLRARAASLHRFDYAAAVLGAVFTPVAADGLLWGALQQALTGTHGATHAGYKLALRGAWGAATRGSAAAWAPWENAAWDFEEAGAPASRLLWHGSRQTNWLSILAQGLRIAPAEAPITGDMFGRGVYLADCASKAANYCHPSRESPVGLLALVQTWVGEPHRLCRAVNGLKAPPSPCHSVLGMGRQVPEPGSWLPLPGLPASSSSSLSSATLAMGPLVPADGLGNAYQVDVHGDDVASGDLLYNEYVVHDASQAVIRWVLQVEFLYDGLATTVPGHAAGTADGADSADDDDVGL